VRRSEIRGVFYLSLQFSQKGKRHSPRRRDQGTTVPKLVRMHAPSNGIVGHDEIGEPVLGDVVEEVLFPDIGQLAVVWGDLGKDGLCC
jgi:hypothetical protein